MLAVLSAVIALILLGAFWRTALKGLGLLLVVAVICGAAIALWAAWNEHQERIAAQRIAAEQQARHDKVCADRAARIKADPTNPFIRFGEPGSGDRQEACP